MGCSPWNSPGQNTGVGCLSLLQRIFPTQGSNPGLLHCRWILYQLSHKGSPLLKSQKQKLGVGSKSRVLCMPPACSTTTGMGKPPKPPFWIHPWAHLYLHPTLRNEVAPTSGSKQAGEHITCSYYPMLQQGPHKAFPGKKKKKNNQENKDPRFSSGMYIVKLFIFPQKNTLVSCLLLLSSSRRL